MQTNISNSIQTTTSMNNIKNVIFASIAIFAIIEISTIQTAGAQSFEPISQVPNIHEDQVIVCVNGQVVQEIGLICHLYNSDDLDYYQDSRDGSFFKQEDSFEMGLID